MLEGMGQVQGNQSESWVLQKMVIWRRAEAGTYRGPGKLRGSLRALVTHYNDLAQLTLLL